MAKSHLVSLLAISLVTISGCNNSPAEETDPVATQFANTLATFTEEYNLIGRDELLQAMDDYTWCSSYNSANECSSAAQYHRTDDIAIRLSWFLSGPEHKVRYSRSFSIVDNFMCLNNQTSNLFSKDFIAVKKLNDFAAIANGEVLDTESDFVQGERKLIASGIQETRLLASCWGYERISPNTFRTWSIGVLPNGTLLQMEDQSEHQDAFVSLYPLKTAVELTR